MGSSHHASEQHVTPFKTYINVFAALIGLTVITVGAAYIHMGHLLNILVAMLIATVKASLVILWFMHQKYENTQNRVIFFSSFFFLMLMLFFCLTDIYSRKTTTQIDLKTIQKTISTPQKPQH